MKVPGTLLLTAVCVILLTTGPGKGQAPSQGTEETITIDGAAVAKPFPHIWETTFGSGRAVLSMRESYRRDLRAVRDVTAMRYVRFHAIFHDEIGVYDEDQSGKPVYNFSYVDQIYDGLLENGIRPFVEISFMPRKLALNLQPHPFWYKQLPSPPKDPAKWAALIDAFTRHLEERYGKGEVQQWYFEVWNEPNIDFWNGSPQQATYFQLYDETAKTIKGVDPALRVGGPATAQAAWADAFIAHCVKNKVPFDFVSTHVYGNDVSKDIFGKEMDIKRRDMVARAAKKVYDQVKASEAPDTPIFWTEYNASYMNQPEVTDSPFMGPWLANNIRECDGLAQMMSYWDFSDVFEEQGVIKKPFYGGYGLVAERGIPKAAFRAFELLHRLGDTRLSNPSENALVTRNADGSLAVALWNYAEPGEAGSAKTFRIDLKNTPFHGYRVQQVGPQNGSALEAWQRMGSPASPTLPQIAELLKASEMAPPQRMEMSAQLTLAPQTLAVLEFDR